MEKEELYKLLAPIKPKQAFSNSLHPEKPDYSVVYNWAALPEIKGLQHQVPSQSFSSITSNRKYILKKFPLDGDDSLNSFSQYLRLLA